LRYLFQIKKSGEIFTNGYQHRRPVQPETQLPFCPDRQAGSGIIVCSVEAVRLSRELEGQNQAKSDVVITILRLIVIPIDSAAVQRVVEIAAATENPVRTLMTMNLSPDLLTTQKIGNHLFVQEHPF
jgi:hypothetical protein